MYNSTIRQKKGNCESCGKYGPLTKKLCVSCYWLQVRLKSANKQELDEREMEDGLPELIEEADAIFSRYVRLSVANKDGLVRCYICDKEMRWQESQCMHYIGRSCLYLRYDLKNCKCGCKECNEIKGGNLLKYGRKLDKESAGATELLLEYSRLVYKLGRDEVRNVISEYSLKLKHLNK